MDYKKASPLELMDGIKQGQQAAFRELFDRFYRLLLGVAINILGDFNLAKDVVQEVFINIWNKRDTLEIKSAVEPFLKRSVINRSLNQIKARKETVDETILYNTPAQEATDANLELDDLKKVIEEALVQLPERCRLIFILKRIEGLSHKEIAEQLEISPKTVENQMTKALKALKGAIKPYLAAEIPPTE